VESETAQAAAELLQDSGALLWLAVEEVYMVLLALVLWSMQRLLLNSE
jgi:hypothetical protein